MNPCRRTAPCAITGNVQGLQDNQQPEMVQLSPEPGSGRRRDRRDRMILGAGALVAVAAIGASMAMLHRDVPFLDVVIERASLSHHRDETALAPSTADPVGNEIVPGAAATTTPTTAIPFSTEMARVDPEATTSTVRDDTTVGDGASGFSDQSESSDPDQSADNGDATYIGGITATTAVSEQPPTPSAEATPGTDPSPTTQATTPGSSTPTTVATTSTTVAVPVDPQLLVNLGCAPGAASGLTMVITPKADGTVRKVRINGFPSACANVKAIVTLRNAAGASLGAQEGTIRNPSPLYLEISGFNNVRVSAVAGVAVTPKP